MYGLLTSDAATIARQDAIWAAAYGPLTSNATKTPQAVQDQNIAKVGVTAQVRTYAQAIANNPGVTAGNKLSGYGAQSQDQHALAHYAAGVRIINRASLPFSPALCLRISASPLLVFRLPYEHRERREPRSARGWRRPRRTRRRSPSPTSRPDARWRSMNVGGRAGAAASISLAAVIIRHRPLTTESSSPRAANLVTRENSPVLWVSSGPPSPAQSQQSINQLR